jgi:micrococcal nuclease
MTRAPLSLPFPQSFLRPPRPSLPLLLALSLALVSPLLGCSADPTLPASGEPTVVEVIDGDTIVVRIGSTTETVRLLGIDTPETKHPTKPVECFGREASAHTSALLPRGTAVVLERDNEERDTFGRLLAHVHRSDGLFVNRELVAQGYAAALVIPPNTAFSSEFRAAERHAREAGLGLWGICGRPDLPIE